MERELSTIGLYILSGAPASGKSTWIGNVKNLPKEAIISSDSLRAQMFGTQEYIDPQTGKVRVRLNSNGDKTVFSIMEQMVEERLKEKLLTVVDSTNTTEKERNFWANIAKKYSVPTTVLLFDSDVEDLISRDLNRKASVGADVIKHFKNKLSTNSSHNLIRVEKNDEFFFSPPTIPTNVDVIGDVHGLYADLNQLLTSLGYTINDGIIYHPENRKVLFVGDWIDRGNQSVDCFRLIHDSVTKGGHFAVMGNHEHKLLKTYKKWHSDNIYTPKSFSSTETMLSMWQIVEPKELNNWMSWLDTLPHYYVKDSFIFCHADISTVDRFQLPLSSAMYGDSSWGKLDSDASFTLISRNQDVRSFLVRGHIPNLNDNKDSRVFSLEDKVGFNGTIHSLPVDKLLLLEKNIYSNNKKITSKELSILDSEFNSGVKKLLTSQKSNFDYSIHQKGAMKLMKDFQVIESLDKIDFAVNSKYGFKIYNEKRNSMTPKQFDELKALENRKLVQHKSSSNGLDIYKYSKKVFFDALWDESPLLLHARGLVLDAAGKIIQNPFVKVFNYGEKGAGSDLSDSHSVIAVEKMNGFLGCVTSHPYERGELLVTTTGSFDSDFVGYINDFINDNLKSNFRAHCDENNQTLMFEVVHPNDPHIIPYTKEQHGLYLIGARGKELNSPLVSEGELDSYAEKFGIKRPKYFNTSLGEVRKLVDEVEHEGFIIRDATTEEPLLKFKSSHYLTIKFLGRMGQGQARLMFEKPEFFKQKIDEEYYPIVDLLVSKSSFESFVSIKSEERIDLIHELIREMWSDVTANKQSSVRPKR